MAGAARLFGQLDAFAGSTTELTSIVRLQDGRRANSGEDIEQRKGDGSVALAR
jgi:hypothetical protein